MKKFVTVGILFLISSCNTKGSWSCPTPEGGKGSCVSIKESDTVSSIPDEKQNFSYLNSSQKIEIKLLAPKLSELKKIQQERISSGVTPVEVPYTSVNNKLRTQEKVGKIWFAPYIDSEGNQHSESVAHVVDEESKWVMQR